MLNNASRPANTQKSYQLKSNQLSELPGVNLIFQCLHGRNDFKYFYRLILNNIHIFVDSSLKS